MGKLDTQIQTNTQTMYDHPWLEKATLPIGTKIKLLFPDRMNEIATYKGMQPNTNWHSVELNNGDIISINKEEFIVID